MILPGLLKINRHWHVLYKLWHHLYTTEIYWHRIFYGKFYVLVIKFVKLCILDLSVIFINYCAFYLNVHSWLIDFFSTPILFIKITNIHLCEFSNNKLFYDKTSTYMTENKTIGESVSCRRRHTTAKAQTRLQVTCQVWPCRLPRLTYIRQNPIGWDADFLSVCWCPEAD